MEPIGLFFVFLIVGVLLISVETIVPGGILGIFGAMSLIAASGIGWSKFSAPFNFISLIGILLVAGLLFFLWIKILPKTGISLAKDGSDFKTNDSKSEIEIDTICETLSPLRPFGFALFNGKRIDVVSDGVWIAENRKVKVSQIIGNKVYVREI